jgi:uracil-DNA glycosylase
MLLEVQLPSRSPASSEMTLDALHTEMRACRRCLEAGFSIVPGAIFSGPATARVMVVGQAPGVTEVEAQRPFNASSGRRLFQWLAEAGWDEDGFRATQYMTAITKCYPGKSPGGKGDRAPSRAEQKLCAPFLERELALVQPEVIIPVGGLAIRRFLGKAKLVDAVGVAVQDEEGRWIVPLPHPSGASLWLNKPEHQALVHCAIEKLRAILRLREIGHLGRLKIGT